MCTNTDAEKLLPQTTSDQDYLLGIIIISSLNSAKVSTKLNQVNKYINLNIWKHSVKLSRITGTYMYQFSSEKTKTINWIICSVSALKKVWLHKQSPNSPQNGQKPTYQIYHALSGQLWGVILHYKGWHTYQ